MDENLIIVCAVFGSVTVVLLVLYRKRFVCVAKRQEPPRPHTAFSLGGNLVRDATTPIEESYHLTPSVLGHGSSAQVVVGEHIVTKRRYAVKIIELTRKEVAWRYEREKNFLRDIDHTNVVRLYEVFTAPTALYFVMELCTGGHLGQVLRASRNGRLKESRARKYVTQLTRAIVHCHYHGICHRDVKLQNILLESKNKDAQIKLLDFGNGARYRGHLPMRKIVGTTYTAAPEVFLECYDERCDVWSLGVVTYILLSGKRPFEKMKLPPEEMQRLVPALVSDTIDEAGSVVASILRGNFNFDDDIWDDISAEAQNFIRYCLVLDYTKRNTSMEMLEHPWLAYTDEDFPTMGANGLSRISQGSATTLQRTLRRRSNSSSQFAGMRNTSMLAVAFNIPTEKIQQLRNLFQEMDQDGSGSIDRDEFLTAVQSVNPDMTKEDIFDIFDRMDQDWNRCISFIEFLAAMVDPEDVDMQDMNQAFQLLDKDNKGYITRDDLMRILTTSNADDLEIAQRNKSTVSPTPMQKPADIVKALSNKFARMDSFGRSKAPVESTEEEREKDKEKAQQSSKSARASAQSALRSKKLQERIQEIIEKADVNKDGVISYTEFLFAMAEGVVGMVGGDNNLESLSKAPSVVPVKHSGWHGGGAGGGGGGHKHHKKAHGVQTPESPLSVAATTSNVDITSTTSSPSMVTPFPSVANQFRSALGVTKMPSPAAHKLPIIRHGRRQTDGGVSVQTFVTSSDNRGLATEGGGGETAPGARAETDSTPIPAPSPSSPGEGHSAVAGVGGGSSRCAGRRSSEPVIVSHPKSPKVSSRFFPEQPSEEDSSSSANHVGSTMAKGVGAAGDSSIDHSNNSSSYSGSRGGISVHLGGFGAGAGAGAGAGSTVRTGLGSIEGGSGGPGGAPGMLGPSKSFRGSVEPLLEPVVETNSTVCFSGCFGILPARTGAGTRAGTGASGSGHSNMHATAAQVAPLPLSSKKYEPQVDDSDLSSDLDSARVPAFFAQSPSFRANSKIFSTTGSNRSRNSSARGSRHQGQGQGQGQGQSNPASTDTSMERDSQRRGTGPHRLSNPQNIVGTIIEAFGGSTSNRSGGPGSARNSGGLLGTTRSIRIGSTASGGSGGGGGVGINGDIETGTMGSGGAESGGGIGRGSQDSADIDIVDVARRLEEGGVAPEDDMRMNDDDQGLLSSMPSVMRVDSIVSVDTAEYTAGQLQETDRSSSSTNGEGLGGHGSNNNGESSRRNSSSVKSHHSEGGGDGDHSPAVAALIERNDTSDSKLDEGGEDDLSLMEYMNTEVYTLGGRT